jgi:hypothetical protein
VAGDTSDTARLCDFEESAAQVAAISTLATEVLTGAL